MAEKIHLKYMPWLQFQADESFDNAERIEALLHSPAVARDLEAEADDASEDGQGHEA